MAERAARLSHISQSAEESAMTNASPELQSEIEATESLNVSCYIHESENPA